ncbi:hypothetical protein ACFYWX_05050 [Streptomyces sp. NPDC002888]|uniref:hypothetical protein n=1 Tax=Streptomyces sp. NPDC002888 TaxID=3364668 RepID=UPI0036A2D11E
MTLRPGDTPAFENWDYGPTRGTDVGPQVFSLYAVKGELKPCVTEKAPGHAPPASPSS